MTGGDGTAPAASPPTRILLVDDDSELRAELRHLLEDGGYSVVGEAGNGVEALALVDQLRPDVVLSDLKMPRMTGLELATRLASRVPVLIFSAFDDQGLQASAHAADVAGYLVKGCRSRKLFAAVEAAVGGPGSPR